MDLEKYMKDRGDPAFATALGSTSSLQKVGSKYNQ